MNPRRRKPTPKWKPRVQPSLDLAQGTPFRIEGAPPLQVTGKPEIAVTAGVHFSSETDRWGTPDDLFEGLARRWGPFDLDAAADETSSRAVRGVVEPNFYSLQNSGLIHPWWGRTFLNPPYSLIAEFMERAADQGWTMPGCKVVALPPARTSTDWWHRWVMRAELIALIDGRLTFKGHARPTDKNPKRGHASTAQDLGQEWGDPFGLGPTLSETDLDAACWARTQGQGCAESAPFPSAVVVWGNKPTTPRIVAMDRQGRMGPYRVICSCGEAFRATRSDARACSARCRMRRKRGSQ